MDSVCIDHDRYDQILNTVVSTFEKLERQESRISDHDRYDQILNTVVSTFEKLERQESRISELMDRLDTQESLTDAAKSSVIQSSRLNDLSAEMERRNGNVILHGMHEISGISDEKRLRHFLVNVLGVEEEKVKRLPIITTKRVGKLTSGLRPLIITTAHKAYADKILDWARASHLSRRFSRDRPQAIQIARRRLNPYFDQCKKLSEDVKVVWPATLLVNGIVRYQFFHQNTKLYHLDLQEQAREESLDSLEEWIQLQQPDMTSSNSASAVEIVMNESEEEIFMGESGDDLQLVSMEEYTDIYSPPASPRNTTTSPPIESSNIYRSRPQLASVDSEDNAFTCNPLTMTIQNYDRG